MQIAPNSTIDRRTFLLALSAAASAVAAADAPRLDTFTQWSNASRAAREAALQPCLERIRAMDESIHAWVQVSPQKGTGSGPLAEIPFAVKDIIETRGLATEYGSPIYKGRIGTADAAIVREMRSRGGVMVGKTHTAAFAYRTPAPTRNPRDLAHTPGGSSSGSAAAVAANMVPVAIGTQTGGSVLRPASYCGVTGFKTTYGVFSTEGVLEYSKSLDTLGFFTHTAADMLAFWAAMGQATGRAGEVDDFALAAPEPMLDVEPTMAAAFHATVARLRAAGVTIHGIDIAGLLSGLNDAQRTISTYEGARAHQQRFEQYGDRLLDVAAMVREGRQIPIDRYDAARRHVADGRIKITEIYKRTPVILVPAATGPAPLGLSSTGDSRMNTAWTALGTPAISIPMPVSNGLPLGLQLTADRGQDARVIRTAIRLEQLLGRSSQ